MAIKFCDRLSVSVYAVMLWRFVGLPQTKVAKKLSSSLRWIAQIIAEEKYKNEYDNLRKVIAESYLEDIVKENPEENLVKWYPALLERMHGIATGKSSARQNEIRAIKELMDLANQYKEKMGPTQKIERPLMSDAKATELHRDMKCLIPLHVKLMRKLNDCGRKNCQQLPKILESS
ncbi:hypothetical protein LCGC14_0406570 [marine sediment metagenome]|uniref:Uncharacterized protein n=1 Tax=marine sediment metagenome TaxID=412755 RepID=A0A0F9TD66_9ZZZZ